MKQGNPKISYELLHTAIQQSPTSIVVTDKEGTIQFVNEHFCQSSGYTFEEVIGKSPRVLKSDFHTPEYYAEIWKTLSSGKTWSGLFKNRKKNGEFYWERAHINPVTDKNGQVTHYVAIQRDVTHEIDNKINSDRRERLLNDIQILSKTGGWELDVPSGNMYWTDELYELHGVTPDYNGDLLELDKMCVHPDDRELIVQSYRRCLDQGIDYDHVVKFVDQKNNRKWVRTKSRAIKDSKGQVTKIIGSVRDVTDEVDSFKAVQNSEARFKAVVSAFEDIVFTLDKKGRHIELFGHWAESETYRSMLIGKTSEEVMGPEAGKVHMDAFRNAIMGLTVTYDWSSSVDKGVTEYYQTKLTPLIIDDQITGILGVGRNISNEVRNLQKLQKSEKRYRDLFNESSDASLLFKNGRIFDCNQAAVELLKYDSIEELTSRHPLDMAPEYQPDGSKTADRYRENVKNAILNRSHRFELYHERKDGVLIPLEVTTTLLQDVDGEDLVYIIWRDISNRLKAQTELKESLKEKETLLSEVHHRVKNNLAVISALMQLQLYSQEDPFAEEILSKSINRIKSIALIHEQLYKSERFSSISLKENIKRQTETVLEMYSDKLATKVNLLLDLQDVSIDINKAMPVGLLLNEILNNIFKHAFKGRDQGTISIKLEETGNEIHVIIADNGVGFDPVKFEDTTSSLGNTLIKTFLEQLNATYTLNSTNGTSFDIRFNKL